jgi:hypothetical protein
MLRYFAIFYDILRWGLAANDTWRFGSSNSHYERLWNGRSWREADIQRHTDVGQVPMGDISSLVSLRGAAWTGER